MAPIQTLGTSLYHRLKVSVIRQMVLKISNKLNLYQICFAYNGIALAGTLSHIKSGGGKLPYLELNRSSLPHVFCLIDMYLEELNDTSKGLQIEKLLHRLRVSNPRLNEKHQ